MRPGQHKNSSWTECRRQEKTAGYLPCLKTVLKATEAWSMKMPTVQRGRTALGGKRAWEFSLREHDLAVAGGESFLVGGHT